jgi:hypothetical protein
LILAWNDLIKATKLSSARVEYQCEPGTPLDHVSVWSLGDRGYLDLIETLGFIMKNQDQFTRPTDACRNGFVLIDPYGR